MLETVMTILTFVYQVGDFLVKAVAAYSLTSEGQKEWGDVLGAGMALGILHPQDVEAAITDQPTPDESAKDATVSGEEQRNTTSAPLGGRIIHDLRNLVGEDKK